MADQKQEKLSAEIKVTIENGIARIEHSDAYNAQQERYFAGDNFTKQEKAANEKLIEAEEIQMIKAQLDPAAYIEQQQVSTAHDSTLQAATSAAVKQDQVASSNNLKNQTGVQSPELLEKPPIVKAGLKEQLPATPASQEPQQSLSEEQRFERAKHAFAEAKPEDLAVAKSNLEGVQQKLWAVADNLKNIGVVMTPEQIAMGQKKAFMDEGDKLFEINEIASNRNSNALTWEVANYSQGAGKTLLNADAGGGVAGAKIGTELHHGLKAPGLDLAEVNVTTSTTNEGVVNGSAGVRGVKLVYGSGDHKVFLAGAADLTASNLTGETTQLGGNVTGLVVNTHSLNGRPTSEIIGANVDVLTGNKTAVGSIAQTFNADTRYATTARAIGTVGVESGSGSFSFEAYQRTGIEGLTARLNLGVADVGGKNEPSGGLGVSYGW